MKFISIREFRAGAAAMFVADNNLEEYVLTNYGKPTAMVVPINEDNFEETLKAFRQARALAAIASLQRQSVKNGTNKMTMEEIDAEIDAARKETKKKR